MPIGTIIAAVAAYIIIAVLLLSMNLFSRWRWWVKATAIVVTGAFFVASYFAIAAVRGWPSNAQLPERFSLVATRVVEPDNFTGAAGAIYMWVEELNENNVPNGRPRSYQLPYTDQLAEAADGAQALLDGGEDVQGTLDTTDQGDQRDAPQNAEAGDQNDTAGGGGNFEPIGVNLTFNDMPAVTLPNKGPL
jgi:hypothetical protein